MDKEIRGENVYYHLTPEEVGFLRTNGFSHITLWYIPSERFGGVRGGRTIGTERSTNLGKGNQRYLEEIMRGANFSINIRTSKPGL